MFRTARWRNDKSKIKAVFKLQFHATQVSQLGADALMVSLVPGDTGKATVRLEKAMIKDGGCRWDSSVYESAKFTRDPSTGKFQDKIYRLILSTGPGKSGFVGEVSLDFADYAEATKASSVSLPIKSPNAKLVLHVSIQRLHDTAEQRDEENDDAKAKVRDRSLRSQFSNTDREESLNSNSTTASPHPSQDVRPLNQTLRNVVANGNFSASSGSDLTTSSESSSGLNTPRENTTRSYNLSSLSSSTLPSEPVVSNGAIVVYGETPKSQWEWSDEAGPGSELDRLRSEMSSLARRADLSELELQTLRKQIVKEGKRTNELSREVGILKEERDLLEKENEKLRTINKQFEATKEKKSRFQYEAGDLPELLEEFRQELDHEKNLNSDMRLQLQKTQESNAELILALRDLEDVLDQKSKEISELSGRLGTSDEEDEEQKALEAIVKGQKAAKDTYVLEQKILDLNGEVEIYRRDRDELEMQIEQLALDYEILKQKHHGVSYKLEQSQLQVQLKLQYECSPLGNEKEEESKIESLERELQVRSKENTDSLATISELESKIERLENDLQTRGGEVSDCLTIITELESTIQGLKNDLQLRSEESSDSLAVISELESKFERSESELKKRLEELSDSSVTISELESTIGRLDFELKKRSEEFSDSLVTISDLEAHVRGLEEELEIRAREFENNLGVVTRAKVEQEKRAISAEEALQKMKWKNFDMADRLQEEFRKLSAQMASTFESNERVAVKAVREAAELRKANEKLQLTIEKGNAERSKLVSSIASMKEELEEKDAKIQDLEAEVETLKARCDEMKASALEHESDKDCLRKEVIEMKGELEKKEAAMSVMRNNKSSLDPSCCDKEVANLRENIRSLEDQIKQKNIAVVLLENSLLEKEKDFATKIEELEGRLEELELCSSNVGGTAGDSRQGELALLKERNESMEMELKEIQQKYSEISLRFAEVEGERQKLVMTVRYLKNARKK